MQRKYVRELASDMAMARKFRLVVFKHLVISGSTMASRQLSRSILPRSTSPNLFGQHPPFQMDANFGTTAGIAEMLIQSHNGTIYLLPALPEEWPTREVKGLRPRGGYVVDIKWSNGKLVSAQILAKNGGEVTVKYGPKAKQLSLKPGKCIQFKVD